MDNIEQMVTLCTLPFDTFCTSVQYRFKLYNEQAQRNLKKKKKKEICRRFVFGFRHTMSQNSIVFGQMNSTETKSVDTTNYLRLFFFLNFEGNKKKK